MKSEKILFIIIGIYFLLSGLFHFARLALGLDIIVGDNYIDTMVSAICVLFSVFIIYSIVKIQKNTKEKLNKGNVIKQEKEDTE